VPQPPGSRKDRAAFQKSLRGGDSPLTNQSLTHRITLVIATGNRGKFREIASLLQGLDALLVPLDRAGLAEVPPEGGESFQENARRKAEFVARATGRLALADDSGLEVDALGGQPGVLSARFGGPGKSDADRNRLVLGALEAIPIEKRTARFRCVVAIADPNGLVSVVDGSCEGRIAFEPRGNQGFGYDPIFEIPSLGRTLAEVGSGVKNRLSHRAQAIAKARTILEGLVSHSE
jgi:XTP/dITP diphosphohydrolase